MDLRSKIVLIFGPTASGKSDFAIKLAKKIKGEIINADSMQVYKELKILTARPLKNISSNENFFCEFLVLIYFIFFSIVYEGNNYYKTQAIPG